MSIRSLARIVACAAAAVSLETTIPSIASAQQAPVTVQRIGVWGCMECRTGHQFAEIAALDVTGDGTLYVVDRDEPRVRVFGVDGRLRVAFGRRGEGPGELQSPFAIGASRDGSIQVVDIRLGRVSRYASDGRVLGTVPMRSMPVAAARHPDRQRLFVATVDFRGRTGSIERLDPGAEKGEIVVASTEGFPPSEGIAGTIDALAVSPSGVLAVGDGRAEYRIRRYSPDGRVIAPDIVREIAKTPRTPGEIAEIEQRMAGRGAQMRAAMEKQSAGSSSPVRMPAANPLRNHFGSQSIGYDDAGRLWVRTERGGVERTVFDLFDAAGAFLGEVHVPGRLGNFALSGDYLAAATRGEDDIPAIALWRVVARGR